MAVIVPEKVSLSQSWGVQFGDFYLDGKHTDFQDLMVAISQNRATTVEGEVTRKGSLQPSSKTILLSVFGSLNWDNLQMTKAEVEEWLQKVKSKIDALNNEAQKDMTRLESLVNRRDEAFSTASDLMSKIGDTRSNAIRNM